ncbi:helix-turn-helix domain-containing protein [Neglectibacter sp. X4]|uniref:helix-turn-helix domain-containing protein n=1 Tax=unclassified Neglectibacter TaxID=2632164 RepID=UPI00352F6B92
MPPAPPYLRRSPAAQLYRRPITAIALDCGFSSPSYFTKCFKAEMGCSPREYRGAVGSSIGGE